MRPLPNEQKTDYVRRFNADYALFPDGVREAVMEQMWAVGPVPQTPLDVAVDACCQLTKADIPQVQASIFLVEPTLAAIWEQMLDRVAADLSSAQTDDLGPEWLLTLMNELWKGLAAAPQPAQVEAIRHGAYRLG